MQETSKEISSKKYRLITRSDMDGIICAVMLQELGIIDDILFVHPKDMQDGKIDVTDRDITTNLPYVEGAYLVFDHHSSEETRIGGKKDNYIIDPNAPSAARVVYDYYGGAERFVNISEEMLVAVDKIDSADLTEEEILNPDKWIILGFLMDSRTGLGRYHHFRISNYDLMMQLINELSDFKSIDYIMELPDVKERVDLYREHAELSKEQIKRCASVHKNLVTLDLRPEEMIYTGNRFMIYALFPDTNISMHIMWGRQKQNTVFAVGKSITNRTSKTNVGELMLKYGGGGHVAAGTCQIGNDTADISMLELINTINSDG